MNLQVGGEGPLTALRRFVNRIKDAASKKKKRNKKKIKKKYYTRGEGKVFEFFENRDD